MPRCAARPATPVYRVQFHPALDPDPRDELAADAALAPPTSPRSTAACAAGRRLDVRAVDSGDAAIIAERPAVRAADLAAALGRERAPFKLDVRKLKGLGLTHQPRTRLPAVATRSGVLGRAAAIFSINARPLSVIMRLLSGTRCDGPYQFIGS